MLPALAILTALALPTPPYRADCVCPPQPLAFEVVALVCRCVPDPTPAERYDGAAAPLLCAVGPEPPGVCE